MTIRERLAVARAGARPRRGFAGLGILALALAVDCGTVTPAAAAFSTDVVETTSGPVRGVAGFTVNKFLGIRYAVSPAAPNRWLPPQAPTPSTSVIDATRQRLSPGSLAVRGSLDR